MWTRLGSLELVQEGAESWVRVASQSAALAVLPPSALVERVYRQKLDHRDTYGFGGKTLELKAADMVVDGQPVHVDGVLHGSEWVGMGRIDQWLLTINSSGGDIESLELEEIKNTGPYLGRGKQVANQSS